MGQAKLRRQANVTETARGCPYHVSLATLPTPVRVRALPVDARGFPVPRFVAWFDGQPDHRVIDPNYFTEAVDQRLCWVCGQPLGAIGVFVFGPASAIERTSGEPPCHLECAEYAVRACPFISRPTAHRRAAGLPEKSIVSEAHVDRNPGVMALWATRSWHLVRTAHHEINGGYLLRVGDPAAVSWYSAGRRASSAEVARAIEAVLPRLAAVAEEADTNALWDKGAATFALARRVGSLAPWLPQEELT